MPAIHEQGRVVERRRGGQGGTVLSAVQMIARRKTFISTRPQTAGAIRFGMPSGILTVDADVGRDAAGAWVAHSGAFYRTARRLFDGRIYVPV